MRPIRDAKDHKRRRYVFGGIVQGVGFRPFIYRTAKAHHLSGYVLNRTDGVVAEVQGTPADLEGFVTDIQNLLPPLAHITSMAVADIEPQDDASFEIRESQAHGSMDVLISPDMAVCEPCLAELFDPADRRYRYAFINCTDCGPRLTIINDIPYDRINTSMACFPLCPACRKEYEDPLDRRFHAEPNACPVCGPHLTLLDAQGEQVPADDPLLVALGLLGEGKILAVKGIGGFHLAVDAADDAAVQRLRARKYREEKPLAIMVKDIPAARALSELKPEEEKLLMSPQRPIVLVRKRSDAPLSPLVAPGMFTLGIMLPYTPLQHLLLGKGFTALVMTSANQTDEPISIGNREAVKRLAGIADAFLVHNRDILVRCDDSIAFVVGGQTRMMRRSRGFAPRPLALTQGYPEVLALGPQLKSTLCILKGRQAFLSPHIGDMETPQARDFFHENVALMQRITQCRPVIVACDLHPGYYSTRVAEAMTDIRSIKVQHHHAHIVSAMAENGLQGEVIGLSMDGTGYGTDGHVWGGEFLIADERSFRREGHIREFLLPGGEKAVREPWRIGISLLRETYAGQWPDYARRLRLIPEGMDADVLEKVLSQRINSPLTSSLGRLFDGVAALLGLRRTVSFEGQAAMELEAVAQAGDAHMLEMSIQEESGVMILDPTVMVRDLVQACIRGEAREELAQAFHRAFITAAVGLTLKLRERSGLNRVALSGGCFQNRILLEGCIQALSKHAFEVFHHHEVPTNDGGISLGQAVCAGARVLAGQG
ncbi:MAG: carbamoyltransferase HypF [Syntrophaceae bacterium]